MKNKKPTTAAKIRPILEVIGLVVLLVGLYRGKEVIGDALDVIKTSDILPLLACFALAWLNFLWSGIGYKLLLQKPISLGNICLAHLAAGGPGRVVPGGAGHMSFGTLFLRKNGLTTAQSLAVSITNNAVGFIVNIILLAALYIVRPSLLGSVHVSAGTVAGLAAGVAALAISYVYIQKNFKSVKKGSRSFKKDVGLLLTMLRGKPLRAVLLILTMLATIATNSAVLYIAANAVHMDLAFTKSFIAMSSGVALGSLLPTPGGIGGVEAGVIASLYALGYPLELSTSTALLFRAATYLQPIIPGCFAYIWLRKKDLL